MAEFYEKEERISTEHAVIDDNGDSVGTRSELFSRAEKDIPDGSRATQVALVLSEDEMKLTDVQRAKRDELERKLESIKAKRESMKPDDYYRGIIEKIKPLGWHVVLYFEPSDLKEKYDFFTSLGVPVVIDHMGRPDVTKPVDGEEFALFLKFMSENESVWSKVSCPDRLSFSGSPLYADVVPFAKTIVEEFPDRVLWGTDWPHPNMKKEMPDDGILVDYVPSIATTAALQEKLLVTNPINLYWS